MCCVAVQSFTIASKPGLIVCLVEALVALADEIEARFKNAQAQVEKLTPSFLARAFHGQLVPQEPDDEPASVLLERIHGHEHT